MGALSLKGKVLAGFFQSVTPRTAGFNTLNLSDLRSPTIFLMTFLMFIGGSPASTAGGIKTTTLAVILLFVWSMIRGREETVVSYRRISREVIQKSFMVFTLFASGIMIVTFIICVLEDQNFLYILFETTSAFATVGLSCGLTPGFSDGSKLALIFSMYAGRVGLITVMFALLHNDRQPKVSYPSGKVIVG